MMMERTTLDLQNSPKNYVLRLLTRAKPPAERFEGEVFMRSASGLKSMGFTGLVVAELAGGVIGQIGRLLYQKGRLVWAGQGQLEHLEALQAIQQGAAGSTFSFYPLEGDLASVAFSAVDGHMQLVGVRGPSERTLVLEDIRRRSFSGFLILEEGLSLRVFRFRMGDNVYGLEVPQDLSRYRVSQIEWVERDLPEMGSAPVSAVPNLSQLVSQMAQPAPAPQPVQAPQRIHFPQPAPAPQAASDNTALWKAFQDLMRSNLGERAGRLVAMMYKEHGSESGDQLLQKLSRQLERVAGAAVARSFEERFK